MTHRVPVSRLLRMVAGWLPLLLAGAGASPVTAQVPPDARWRTLETEHFRVTFVEGLDSVARAAAGRAEAAYALLAREVAEPPRGRIELVISDNVDYANGYATPFPTNRIVVFAHPPVDNPELAFTTDWLNLVVLHELVHIFHLDDAHAGWERLRTALGRNPLLFPQIFLPGWVTEGVATYYESRLTPGGRVRGTVYDMMLRAAVLEDRFFPIDRATGDPSTWPGGSTRYVYGALFLDFLASRFGPERVPEFLRRYGSAPVPYRPDAAARRAFGTSFTRAWSAWEDSLRTHYSGVAARVRAAGETVPEVLTPEGRSAAFPRYAPRGGVLAYAAATGRDQPATRWILPDGTVRTVSDRTTLGPTSWAPDGSWMLYSQLDYADPYRIHADLFRLDAGGDEDRLTRSARLLEADLHPDGGRVVAVRDAGATNVLAVHDLAGGESRALHAPRADVHWALPRWSPSGDRIAASRWTQGGLYDVVVLDSTGAVLREVTRDRATDSAPAWSPDGRYLLFASDRTGIWNLFAHDLRDDRLLQVTNVVTGAMQPDVSPDGRWIAFTYYRADGYHVARIPFDPASWRPAPPARPEAAPLERPERFAAAGGEARRYSPWPSVAPSSWAPLVDSGTRLGIGVGALVGGADVIQRHLWGVEATVYPDGGRFTGLAEYLYRGWGRPVVTVAAEQRWRVWRAEPVDSAGKPVGSAILRRDRELGMSLLWQDPRWRSRRSLRTGVEVSGLHYEWEDAGAAGERRLSGYPADAGVVAEGVLSTARGAALSLGPQRGLTTSATVQARRYLSPREGEEEARGYLRWIGRGRGYQGLALPGYARHVLGARLDLGGESGSVSPGFSVGGASGAAPPAAAAGLDLLGGGVAFPVRGFAEGTQVGNRAAVASGEYRFPLLLVDRGFRLVPLFLERVWGDLFLDAGTAWCEGGCERRFSGAGTRPDPMVSVGAEAVLDLQFGYWESLPLRLGVAFPVHGPGGTEPVGYLRIGRSF